MIQGRIRLIGAYLVHMKSNIQIVKEFKQRKQISERGLGTQYQRIRENQSFYAGDMMEYRDSIQFADAFGAKKKAMVKFNKIKPYVNAMKGFMAQNRRKGKYIARMDANPLQNMYSKYANSLADYIRTEANSDQKETQQDGDMLTCGIGAIETDITYGIGNATTDPNGQVLIGNLDILRTGWDPYARDINILDARWVFYLKEYNLKDALELFDSSDEDDFEESGNHEMGEDAGYIWYARGGRYNKIREAALDWSDLKEEMVKIYFYQWYEFETFYRAENPVLTLNNPMAKIAAAAQMEMIAQEIPEEDKDLFSFNPKEEIITFDGTVKEKLVETFGQFIKIYSFKRKVYYKAVISKEHVFTAFRSPCQQGFTTKFKTGDYDAKNKCWTGMVDSMREPMLYYNKALTELMFIIGANSKGGVMVEKSAVEDIQKFEQKYAKTDSVVVVQDGALEKGKIQPKKTPQTATGYEGILTLSDAAITDVNGIDKSFLGSSENKQETAALNRQRIRQVVSAFACYFDAGTLYQKEHSRLLLDLMRIYAENNSGGLFRIIGEDGRDQFLRISADKLAPQYDVSIQEAPQSIEEKQEFSTLISGAADKLLAAGDASSAKQLYAIALGYLPMDQSDKQKIIQILTPQTPQIDPAMVQQLQEQVRALMSDVTQADVKKKLSEFALNLAKVDEVRAKVGEIGSKSTLNRASAFHDVHEALLDEHIAKQRPQGVTVQ